MQNSAINNFMIKEKIQFGSKEIFFNLIFQNRKTLGISVHPDRSVLVKAPDGIDIEKIKAKVKKRAWWILKQQSYFLSFEPLTPPRKYITGETHLYLGRQYLLKVIASPDRDVKLRGKFIIVQTSDRSNTNVIKDQLITWYRSHAQKKFYEYATPWIEKFNKKFNVRPDTIEIKQMEKRWGSCTPKGKIILNLELIKAPKACIEYVIVHELCHLIYKNHTRAFLNLQSRLMPDWEKYKDRLERLLV